MNWNPWSDPKFDGVEVKKKKRKLLERIQEMLLEYCGGMGVPFKKQQLWAIPFTKDDIVACRGQYFKVVHIFKDRITLMPKGFILTKKAVNELEAELCEKVERAA